MIAWLKKRLGWGFSFMLGTMGLYLGLLNVRGSVWCFDFFNCEASISLVGDHTPEFLFCLTILGVELIQINFYSTAHEKLDGYPRFDCPTCEELKDQS